MALALGINCGFVKFPPTVDPAAGTETMDDVSLVMRHKSPAGAYQITEVGWWCDNATEEANFEVGLYAADGAVVPGEAGTLLFSSTTNAKGTTLGWKVVTGLNWTIQSNTTYWIGVQLDNTVTLTNTNVLNQVAQGSDLISSSASLPNPFGGGALVSQTRAFSFYALVKTTQLNYQKINNLRPHIFSPGKAR